MKITTLCRDCVFAGFAPDSIEAKSYTQSCCHLNKLRFDKSELVKDNDTSYYKLDYLCNYCKNEDWAKNNKVDGIGNFHKQKELARKENSVHSDLIVLIHCNHTIEDIKYIIGKIQNQLINKVIFIINNEKIDRIKLNNTIATLNYKWQYITPFEEEDIDSQITRAAKYVISQYYIVVESLTNYNDYLPTLIDNAINDNNIRFCIIQPEEGYHHLVMQNKLQEIHKPLTYQEIIDHYKDTQWNSLIIDQKQLTSH